MLFAVKNQKWPVSPVSGVACPIPLVPCEGTRQETRTWKRPPFKQSAFGFAVQDVPASVGLAPAGRGFATRAGAGVAFPPAAKAVVSATLARVPEGLKYLLDAPVTVSVTVSVY